MWQQQYRRRRRPMTSSKRNVVSKTTAMGMLVVAAMPSLTSGFVPVAPSSSSSLSLLPFGARQHSLGLWNDMMTDNRRRVMIPSRPALAAIQNNNDSDDDESNASPPMAGSFFNPVPESDGGDDDSNGVDMSQVKTTPPGVPMPPDDVDLSLSKALRQRRENSSSLSSSTIGGVPTSEAPPHVPAKSGVGFGSPSPPRRKKSSSGLADVRRVVSSTPGETPYIAIGNPKPLNDVRNPQYDDQGYTLYADEETGERKRVFEALVDYPCTFTLKVVGANQGLFVEEIVQSVADTCGVPTVEFTQRQNGKWISITLQVPVESAQMLYSVYETIDRDPRVRFKF